MVKNPLANAGDTDVSSIPESGRPPGEGSDNLLHIFAWRIPWTEEPGSYCPWGCKELDVTYPLNKNNNFSP